MSRRFALKLLQAALIDARARGCDCSPSVNVRGRPPVLDVSIEHAPDCPAAEVGGYVYVPRAER
jgi:hypothetical protein